MCLSAERETFKVVTFGSYTFITLINGVFGALCFMLFGANTEANGACAALCREVRLRSRVCVWRSDLTPERTCALQSSATCPRTRF